MGPASREGLATPFSIMGQVSAVDFQTLLAASTLASAAGPLIAPALPIAASGAGATSLWAITTGSPAGAETPPSISIPPSRAELVTPPVALLSLKPALAPASSAGRVTTPRDEIRW